MGRTLEAATTTIKFVPREIAQHAQILPTCCSNVLMDVSLGPVSPINFLELLEIPSLRRFLTAQLVGALDGGINTT
jgi:hypothetical protein